VGAFAIIAALVAGAFAVAAFERLRRARVASRYRHLRGESAASAVVVPALARVDWRRVAHCRCGAALSAPPDAAAEEVAYDERTLYVVHATCGACGGAASRYFDVRP
jgi:hypothetical protein